MNESKAQYIVASGELPRKEKRPRAGFPIVPCLIADPTGLHRKPSALFLPNMIITRIDFDQNGKQQGFLQVPYSHNLGGWANVMIPITVVPRGEGPTVLILGGNHGDEYQGQIAAMKLARALQPERVQSGGFSL